MGVFWLVWHIKEKPVSPWKDEDVATPALIGEYLKEFKEGIENNPDCKLASEEKLKVEEALRATETFSLGLVGRRRNILYMHDLILMAMGFYGGYLTALESRKS
jgi:hypothetical protein